MLAAGRKPAPFPWQFRATTLRRWRCICCVTYSAPPCNCTFRAAEHRPEHHLTGFFFDFGGSHSEEQGWRGKQFTKQQHQQQQQQQQVSSSISLLYCETSYHDSSLMFESDPFADAPSVRAAPSARTHLCPATCPPKPVVSPVPFALSCHRRVALDGVPQVRLVADPLAAARDSQLSIFSHNKRQVLALQVSVLNSSAFIFCPRFAFLFITPVRLSPGFFSPPHIRGTCRPHPGSRGRRGRVSGRTVRRRCVAG